MSVADSLKGIARSIRAIPGQFGIRPYTVSVTIRSWTGDVPGEGSTTVTTTPITEADGQPPKVRFLNDEQIALGGLAKGSIEVGPITPDFPGGGTTWATLSGGGADPGETFYYVLTGPEFPNGARFLFAGGKTDRAFRYMVTLTPLSADE